MRLLTSLSMCLICSTALSQQPPTSTAPPPPDGSVQQGLQPGGLSGPGTPMTQRSRVRAFAAGPDGQIRSVYLSNGTVVDLTGFGTGFGPQMRKGNRIRVSGVQTIVNGQTIVTPQQIMVGQQTFSPMPDQRLASQAGVGPQPYGQPPAGPGGPSTPPPPPPPGGPGAPPPPPPPAGAPRQGQADPGAPRRGYAPQPGAASGTPAPLPPDGSQPPPATPTSPGSMTPPPSPTTPPNQ